MCFRKLVLLPLRNFRYGSSTSVSNAYCPVHFKQKKKIEMYRVITCIMPKTYNKQTNKLWKFKILRINLEENRAVPIVTLIPSHSSQRKNIPFPKHQEEHPPFHRQIEAGIHTLRGDSNPWGVSPNPPSTKPDLSAGTLHKEPCTPHAVHEIPSTLRAPLFVGRGGGCVATTASVHFKGRTRTRRRTRPSHSRSRTRHRTQVE